MGVAIERVNAELFCLLMTLAFIASAFLVAFCTNIFTTEESAEIKMENTLQLIHEGKLEIYRDSYSVIGDKITNEVYKVRAITNSNNKVEK
jgi:hypothetical protein